MVTAKTTIVLVLAYVLALAAGTTSGVLAQRWHGAGPADANAPLAVQLQLTADQARQMRQIWEKSSGEMDDFYRQAQGISQKRDQVLFDLLTDEQKAKFALTDKGYHNQFAALAQQRQEAFKHAVAETEQCLNDQQRLQYEQIIRQRTGMDPLHAEAATQPSLDQLRP